MYNWNDGRPALIATEMAPSDAILLVKSSSSFEPTVLKSLIAEISLAFFDQHDFSGP